LRQIAAGRTHSALPFSEALAYTLLPTTLRRSKSSEKELLPVGAILRVFETFVRRESRARWKTFCANTCRS
jgi:hypothetical protein